MARRSGKSRSTKKSEKDQEQVKSWLDIKLDDWQEQVLNTEGNICLRSGRQVGKSFIIGKKAAKYAIENKNKLIMVIAFTEKQANLLFSKILHNIVMEEKYTKKKLIAKPKPTKHIIHLINGSTIHCYAAGDTGYGIMGFTIDLLIADEAAWIKEEVWNSIIPALAATNGTIWLLSTPYLSKGYYFEKFNDKNFTSFHQTSEDCPRIDKEFLEQRKKELTSAQYNQMYMGNFVDDVHRIFNDRWIEKVCTMEPINQNVDGEKAIGIDVAGTGEDESSYEVLYVVGDTVYQNHHEVVEKQSYAWLTNMITKIKQLNHTYQPEYIGIDGGGLGSGVVSLCLADPDLKSVIYDLNNSKRVIDKYDRETTKSMKEAMYMNMLAMGERGELKLFNKDEIKLSLKSIFSEKREGGREVIDGNYSHITEGLVRAAWLLKDKDINMNIYTIKV